jgi:hypothetical protein
VDEFDFHWHGLNPTCRLKQLVLDGEIEKGAEVIAVPVEADGHGRADYDLQFFFVDHSSRDRRPFGTSATIKRTWSGLSDILVIRASAGVSTSPALVSRMKQSRKKKNFERRILLNVHRIHLKPAARGCLGITCPMIGEKRPYGATKRNG